jgi:hypothetical protein
MNETSICAALLACSLLLASDAASADGARWVTSRVAEQPLSPDGGLVLEGVDTAPEWAWHGATRLGYEYGPGLAESASRFRLDVGAGFGFPAGLEVALAAPLMWTVGSADASGLEPGPRPLDGMSDDGPGFGDLSAGVLYRAVSAANGGFGLLIGAVMTAPTGNHDRLMGEGGYTFAPYLSLAFKLFESHVGLNLGYRLRPERVGDLDGVPFEQDDDIFWRAGLRVVSKKNVGWNLEAEGSIAVATSAGFWPDPTHRPVWVGGGLDFEVSRHGRLGVLLGIGVSGATVPRGTFAFRYTLAPNLPDEDNDGLRGRADACPLLAEDYDGFEDDDGCPDLDNDADGFPDDEDACPDTPATDDLSTDGC